MTNARPQLLAFCLLAFLVGCGGSDTSKTDKASMDKEGVALKIAHASESSGDAPAAEKAYQQIAKQSPKDGALELADFYVRQHQDAKATDTLNEALHNFPKDPLLTRALANLYIHRHMPDKALAAINDIAKKNAEDALLNNSKGVALDMLGKYHEAQTCYRNALRIAPDEAMTFKANLGMSYILEGHPKNAVSLLAPLLKNPDVTPTVRQNLAMAYALTEQKTKAKALALQDMSPEEAQENLNFYHLIALAHTGKGGSNDKEDAIPAPLPPVIP